MPLLPTMSAAPRLFRGSMAGTSKGCGFMDEEDEDIMMVMYSPERRYPIWSSLLLDEEDFVLLKLCGDDEEPVPHSEKGCMSHEAYKLSPSLPFSRDLDGDFVLDVSSITHLVTTPVKRLFGSSYKADFVANCVRRLRSIDRNSVVGPEYSIGFVIHQKALAGALHAKPKDKPDERRASCIATCGYPATCFDDLKIHKCYLKWDSEDPDAAGVAMIDPITGIEWSAKGFEACGMDVTIFTIDEDHAVGHKEKVLHSFDRILLPVSTTFFSEATPLICGVVGYPLVDELLSNLDEAENAYQICKTYQYTVKDEFKKRVRKNFGKLPKDMNEETLKYYKEALKKELCRIVEPLLRDSLDGLKTGMLVCSMGRLLATNGTALAANYSTLRGCSGSPVFSPQLPLGTFIGVHNGAANPVQVEGGAGLNYPDHNVATSTDNPAFVQMYSRVVLPKLPSPSKLEGEEREIAFQHYLLKHLDVVKTVYEEKRDPHVLMWLEWAKEVKRGRLNFDSTC